MVTPLNQGGGVDSKILVSISCLAFNHEPYIRDAIEGFLNQKTSFNFEVLIHDDASTDNTAKIIREYEGKYPDVIRPIYQEENQYSKRDGTIGRLQRSRAKGEYYAICEGDDYWIDPYKLQKQVEFLENNPDFGVVHGDCHFLYQEKDEWEYNANSKLINNKELSSEELFNALVDGSYKIRTATVLFRTELLKKRIPDSQTFLMGDTPMWLDFSQITKFKYFDESFSVYRILENSASRSTDKKKHYRFNLSMYEMRIHHCLKFEYEINTRLKNKYNNSLINYKLYDQMYEPFYTLFEIDKIQSIKYKILTHRFIRKLLKYDGFVFLLSKLYGRI
jgi:glycosyltransferase involved in cell wall biosynthesis